MLKNAKCPACTSDAKQDTDSTERLSYACPICGKFELQNPLSSNKINMNHLAAYFVHHAPVQSSEQSPGNKIKQIIYTVLDKEQCDYWRKEMEADNKNLFYLDYVHIDESVIEAWYPRNFTERIDYILLYLAKHTEHVGQVLELSVNRLLNVLFVDKQKIDEQLLSDTYGLWVEREEGYVAEAEYMLQYLKREGYIETKTFMQLKSHKITLAPKGYARVDVLQKYIANGRNVFVAMNFNNTEKLREAIREGIRKAGYSEIFIDEVQHNEFITPELLKNIKDSKFVVVDLTHKNNGAYFEEGYAMGLGKTVIQLCKYGVKLHFDVAQKNTIMWEKEEDIPEKLYNRIKATIE